MGTKVSVMTINKSFTQAVGEVLTREKSTIKPRITFDAVSERTGISRRQVIRYFAGERSMSLAELELVCDVLSLDLFDVMKQAQDRVKS